MSKQQKKINKYPPKSKLIKGILEYKHDGCFYALERKNGLEILFVPSNDKIQKSVFYLNTELLDFLSQKELYFLYQKEGSLIKDFYTPKMFNLRLKPI